MKRFIKNLAMLEMKTFPAITLSSFMLKLQVFFQKIHIQGFIQLSTQGWPLPWGSWSTHVSQDIWEPFWSMSWYAGRVPQGWWRASPASSTAGQAEQEPLQHSSTCLAVRSLLTGQQWQERYLQSWKPLQYCPQQDERFGEVRGSWDKRDGRFGGGKRGLANREERFWRGKMCSGNFDATATLTVKTFMLGLYPVSNQEP